MKTSFLFTLLLASGLALVAQDPIEKYLGNYEGIMTIHQGAIVVDSVPVQFDFHSLETPNEWSYIMTYQSPKYGTIAKEYKIVRSDSLDAHIYLLDEQDGTFIPLVLMDNCFYSTFDVQNMRISSVMRFEGSQIFFELFSAKIDASTETQSNPDEQGDSYLVTNYSPFITQKVLFKKIE